MDLAFDPDDGRETGLRLKRPARLHIPDVEGSLLYDSGMNGAIHGAYVALMDEVRARAEIAYALGYQIEELNVQSSVEGDPDGGLTLKVSATFQVVNPVP